MVARSQYRSSASSEKISGSPFVAAPFYVIHHWSNLQKDFLSTTSIPRHDCGLELEQQWS
jgi:hypothetical protein